MLLLNSTRRGVAELSCVLLWEVLASWGPMCMLLKYKQSARSMHAELVYAAIAANTAILACSGRLLTTATLTAQCLHLDYLIVL